MFRGQRQRFPIVSLFHRHLAQCIQGEIGAERKVHLTPQRECLQMMLKGQRVLSTAVRRHPERGVHHAGDKGRQSRIVQRA